MKPIIRNTMLSCVLALGALVCAPQSQAQQAVPAGDNPNFHIVQQELDTGGTFYLYMDISGALRKFVDEARQTYGSLAPQAPAIINMADMVINQLGLYDLAGLGVSVYGEGGDWAVTRAFLHLPEGPKGLMALMGGEAAPPFGLDHAPANSVYFASGDLDADEILPLVRKIAQDIGGVQAISKLDEALNEGQRNLGISPEVLLNSLNGHFMGIMDFDATNRLNIPMGDSGDAIDAPQPRLSLLIDVRDSTLYDLIARLCSQQGIAGEKEQLPGGISITPLLVPDNPVYKANPAFGQRDNLFFITTHREHVQPILVGAGGLAQTPDFQRLHRDMPNEGNALVYVSPEFGKAYLDLMGQFENVIQRMGQSRPEMMQASMQFAMARKGAESWQHGGLTMRINKPNGIQVITRSQGNAQQVMLAVAAVPVAVLAAIAVPNFLEAQTRAKVSRVRSDHRTMATALEAYFIDNNTYPPVPQPVPSNYDARMALKNLTSPIAYMTALPEDPFLNEPGQTFRYFSPGTGKTGWILWSPGPDQQWDLQYTSIPELYTGSGNRPYESLIPYTFDPTNGTTSRGDVFRYKQ